MQILEIAKRIENIGGRLYLVGGAIRNRMLGIKAIDEDYVVVGLDEEKFTKLFPKAYKRGKAFNVFDIDGKEFALARKESKNGVGHKEFNIICNKNITLRQDLKRRDITINAIAEDVITKEIIDPFNGRTDLEQGILRAISTSFSEDPLRVYRVARFAATFGFKVETKTIKMMKQLRKELNSLSKERVFTEFEKALEGAKPSLFFEVLKKANVLDVHFKEIYDLIGAIQPKKYHPEGDSYNHTMIALENSTRLTKNPEIRFCVLVHDLGKGRTPKEMYPHHYGHEERGIEPLKELSKRIGIPKHWEKSAKTAILEHMKGGKFQEMSITKRVGFIEKIDKTVLGLTGLQIVVYADKCRELDEQLRNEEYNFEKIGREMLETINGKYIEEKYKIKPNKEFAKKIHNERILWMRNNY